MLNMKPNYTAHPTAIADFLEEVDNIPKTDFFIFSDMWKNPDIKSFIYSPTNLYADICQALYYVPSMYFRYVYFFLDKKTNPQIPQHLKPSDIKEALVNKGYIFEFDHKMAILGIPESHFDHPYASKLDYLMEDRFC